MAYLIGAEIVAGPHKSETINEADADYGTIPHPCLYNLSLAAHHHLQKALFLKHGHTRRSLRRDTKRAR